MRSSSLCNIHTALYFSVLREWEIVKTTVILNNYSERAKLIVEMSSDWRNNKVMRNKILIKSDSLYIAFF